MNDRGMPSMAIKSDTLPTAYSIYTSDFHSESSANNTGSILHYTVLLGVLSAAATALQVIEAPLPRLLPWLKPGLSNALILFGLIRVSALFGCGLIVIRTLLSGIVLGTLLSPPNLLSFIGGISSTCFMVIALKISRRRLGIGGISIIGALVKNAAQLLAVGFFLPGGVPIWVHIAFMIWISIPSGLIVAKITHELLRRT